MTAIVLFFLLLPLAIRATSADTITQTTQFEDYPRAVDNANTVADKLLILHAVWHQLLNAEDQLILERAERFLEDLHVRFVAHQYEDITRDQQKESAEFYELVRELVIEENTRRLALSLNGDIMDQQFGQELAQRFTFSPEMRYKIFTNAIERSYGLVDPAKLSVKFYLMYVFADIYNEDTATCFDTVFNAELYVFWKFLLKGDVNDNFLMLASYFFKEAQARNLTTIDRRRLDKGIAELPSSLRYLLSASNICLLNVAYNEYLFEPSDISMNDRRSFVFTWHEKRFIGDDGPWNIEIFPDYNFFTKEISINGQLRTWQKQEYLYRVDSLENNIFAAAESVENSSDQPVKDWRLKLIENKIVLKQEDGARLCAVDEFYNNGRRFVRALNVNNSGDHCAWIIDDCPTVNFN